LCSANEQAAYNLVRYKSSLECHNCWFPIRLGLAYGCTLRNTTTAVRERFRYTTLAL